MEIKYLRDFVALAEMGNFTEAADSLFFSQSTLSKHIHSIESELGIPLFDRTTRKVSVSKYGQLFLPFARQIVALQDEYIGALHNNLASNREILTLGTIKSLAQYNITDILVNFTKSRPQSTVKIIHAESNEKRIGSQYLIDKLRQKQCELAFIRDFSIEDDLVKIPYVDDCLVAVFPTNHPLAKIKTIQLQMLAKFGILLLEEYTYIHKLCINACKQNGFEPKVVFTDAKPENLIELVSKGMGIALLMRQLAIYFSNTKIAIVDITPTISSQICLCYLKDAKLSDAASHFVLCTELQREKNQFVPA